LVRLEKSDCLVCQTGVSDFGNFQSQTKEGAKLEDSKIQGVLKLGKRVKGIKGLRYKKIKQEAKVTKIGPSGLPNWTIQFF
jgi:hypothetical protein